MNRDGELPASAFKWTLVFHHDSHVHDGPPLAEGVTSGSFTLPTTGETADNVWYRLYLTVTDSKGLTNTVYRDILPRKTTVSFATNPAGLQVVVDGKTFSTQQSLSIIGVEGITREISVPSPQTIDGITYEFESWSQGGSASQTIATPADDVTYTATFTATSKPNQPDNSAFYRAINLHGDALTIDGYSWEGSNADNLTHNGYTFTDNNVALSPETDESRTAMIRSSVYAQNLSLSLSSVPDGNYDVYLYVWEDNDPQTYTIYLQGNAVKQNHYSGAAGTWEKIGPYTIAANNGAIELTTSGGDANISGIEIWKSTNTPPTPGTATYAINAGGGASGAFTEDSYFNGGLVYATDASVNGSNEISPAPENVYQTERYGNFTYTFPNLKAGQAYTVRLHFAENWFNEAGQRLFNVTINGNQELANYDIFAAVGEKNKAIVKEFLAQANSQGEIVIDFSSVLDNALVDGIEIKELSTASARVRIESSRVSMSVHPNPADEAFTVSYEAAAAETVKLTITDMYSRTYSQTTHSAQPGTNNFVVQSGTMPSGTYLVTIRNGNEVLVEKVFIR